MLAPVNVQRHHSLNSPKIKNSIGSQNFVLCNQNIRNMHEQKKDVFFTGYWDKKKYPSGEYSDEEIKEAKQYLDDPDWEKKHYKKHHIKVDNVYSGDSFGLRAICAIFTFGGTEVLGQIVKAAEQMEFNGYYVKKKRKMGNLITDLLNERLNEQAAEAERVKQNAARKAQFEKQKFDIKENQIKPQFCDLVQREKEKKKTSIPNCIMLVGSNPKVTEELIEWTGKNSNCNFVEISHTDKLLPHLKEAKAKYNETGDRTLIHVKGFDQLINPEITSNEKIESLKSIMSQASEDYHSTIIFNAQDPSKLDQIALQPHRVERIEADIKTPEEMAVEDAKTRLNDVDRPVKCPVATINDLLIIYNPGQKLKLGPSPEELKEIKGSFSWKLYGNEKYRQALNTAIERLE